MGENNTLTVLKGCGVKIDHVTLKKVNSHLLFPYLSMIAAKNHFDKPYIKGDIKLRKYCNDGIAYDRLSKNKWSHFQGLLNMKNI